MASDAGYRRLLAQFGGRRVQTISAADIDGWRDKLAETMSPATVNLRLTILRATLRLAVRNRRIEAPALPSIRPLKINNVHVRYLTEDEEKRLLEAAPEWLRPLITVAIHTGMRRGELLRLTWTDIDFVSGTIWVRLSKSGEARRIPLSPTAHRTLSALRDARRECMRARVVKRSEAAGTVFTTPEGGFMMNLGRA
jgi:integrase